MATKKVAAKIKGLFFPGMISKKDLIEILKAKRGKKFLTDFASELGVSFQHLAKVLAGEAAGPGPTIAKALGFEQVAILGYRRLPRKAAKGKR